MDMPPPPIPPPSSSTTRGQTGWCYGLVTHFELKQWYFWWYKDMMLNIDAAYESNIQSQVLPQPGKTFVRLKIRTKKRKAPCWDHAEEYERINEKGQVVDTIARCNYCSSDFACDSKKHGNSGIINHLKRCKKNPSLASLCNSSQPILTQASMGNSLITHTFSQKRLEERVVEFVIRDEMPFRVVGGAGFVAMVKEAQPKFKIPNRKKVANSVWDLFVKEKGNIKSAIVDQRVSITTDTWTSIQNINYMVITVHFLDKDWKLHKRIINFTKITSHKGDDIGKVLESCLNDWKIKNIFSITVDNASANDKAVEYMKKRLDETGNLFLDGKYLHLRCSCHIINLIVKSGLKFLDKSVSAIRNCVKYIHSSSSRLDRFRECAILLNMDKMSTVPLDVSTRWNSSYTMLSVAYKFRKVFARMLENSQFCDYFNEVEGSAKRPTKRVGPPDNDDWDKSLVFVQFLKRYHATTLVLSASKTVTSTLILDEVVAIGASINEALLDTSHEKLQEVATHMDKKFKKYWGDLKKVNKLVFLGHILDPCHKLGMINIHLDDMNLDVVGIESFVKELKECLVDLYHAYKGSSPLETLGGNLDGELEKSLAEKYKDDPIKLKKHLKMAQQSSSQNQVPVANEVDRYLSEPCVRDPNFCLLDWWKGHSMAFPILSMIAKDIFAIPSSTVASESAFSLGKRVVDPFRASLYPKMVEALVCTSDWLRGEEINLYKEPTEEELEFYKACEEFVASSQELALKKH